ncbi:unnamed protein product [Diamesa serratosioi]
MKLNLLLLLLVSIVAADDHQTLVINQMFKNLGSLDYTLDGRQCTSTYYVSREIKLVWAHALMFCRSFGMELVSLPTKELADKFTQLCYNNAQFFDKYTHIGGTYIGAGLNNWYWISDGKPVSYPIPMLPGEPNNARGVQNCLALDKQNGPFLFNDIDAFGHHEEKFVCESKPKSNNVDLRSDIF